MPTLFNLDTHQHETIFANYSNTNTASPLSTVSEASMDSSHDTGFTMISQTRSSSVSPSSTYSDASLAVSTFQNLNIGSTNMVVMESSPYLAITEQPVDKFRFRYKSEMHGTHGSLTGVNTSKSKRFFPSVHLNNFSGDALIRCSLYQTDAINKILHSHSLVVRRENEDCKDPHDVMVSTALGYSAVFQGMGIIHTAKKFIVDELYEKLRDRQAFLQNRPSTELEEAKLRIQAENESKSMNLNQVCLCFEAYQLINDRYESICEPVLSNPINNMKSALTGELKITRLSIAVSDAAGNNDLFLFVEKVGKKNIKVRFYEVDEFEEVTWEDWGRFSEADVHHQYAIALRTPPYGNKDIENNVNVFIQLVRPSDGCESAPVPFRYKPRSCLITRKRARISSAYSSFELPSVINDQISPIFIDQPNTISKEFNKSDLIDGCLININSANISLNSDDMNSFLKFVQSNSDEYVKMFSAEQNDDYKLVRDGATPLQTTNIAFGVQKLRTIIEKIITSTGDKQEAQMYFKKLFNTQNAKGQDILHMVIPYNDFDDFGINKLIKLVHDYQLKDVLRLQNKNKDTALHIACVFNKWDYVKALLRNGADPNIGDDKGRTPLHIAVAENFERCVMVIVSPNNHTDDTIAVNLNIANDDGLTALHIATRSSNLAIVKRLLDAGASPKISESKHGNNILHIAVEQGSEELVTYILAATNIDVTLTNTAGNTPFDLAAAANPPNIKIINMLIEVTTQKGDNKPMITDVSTKYHTFNNNGTSQMVDIKTEIDNSIKMDYVTIESHLGASAHREDDALLDETSMMQLCEIFNKSEQWKQLAAALGFQPFISVWEISKNPAMTLLKFLEVQGRKLNDLVIVFQEIGSHKALSCIDAMIARRLEDDD